MRILWITNNLLPDACPFFKIPVTIKTGWLHSAANQIKDKVELYIATTYRGNKIKEQKIKDITYILIPSQKKSYLLDESTYPYWQQIKNTIQPNIVHIHGTEYPIGLSYINSCGTKNVIISIQGLISICSNFYNAGMNNWEILKNTTLRDILKGQTLWNNHRKFYKQGKYETEYLKRINNFIGRTEWDHAQIHANNISASYFFNNETLRASFYHEQWDIKKIKRHSIFFSQATYPLKGLHQLLKAMPTILKQFPDTQIFVAGFDVTQACANKPFLGKILGTTYGHFIYAIIKKLKLEKHITFLGKLEEANMKDIFLKSHVFVSASAIENSSNSICEAQILGTPIVASFVGGTDSIVDNNITGLLYPFDDINRLAFSIIKIFTNDDLAIKLSKQGQTIAHNRHNPTQNRDQLLNIYKKIIERE